MRVENAVVVAAAAMILITGCHPAPSVFASAKAHPAMQVSGDPHALRVKHDTTRNRIWVLGLDHVSIYDRSSKRLIRRVALPPWSVAEFVCEPDLALDSAGSAFISHNSEPRLWQIDPDSFDLREHVIRLANREQLDIGFGRLSFAADGSLIGVASSGGSLWRIDVRAAQGQEIGRTTPLHDTCEM